MADREQQNARRREQRRQKRIEEAALGLMAAVRGDGATIEDHGLDLRQVQQRLIAAAGQLAMGNVHREFYEEDVRDLLDGLADGNEDSD